MNVGIRPSLASGAPNGNAADGAEIDIYEGNRQSNRYATNVHFDGYGKFHKSINRYIWDKDLHNGQYHTYGLHLTKDFLDFYFDGRRVRREEGRSWIPHVPHYMIVSGGIFGGDWVDGSVRNDNWPASMFTDHVRAWQEC